MELVIRNLSKAYGSKKALDGVTFTFREGLTAILGENGAGKSTLMNLITDNIRRTAGEILFDGTDILKMGADFRAVLGFMPQQQGLYENMSGRQFLLYMAGLKGLKGRTAREETERLLEVVNLKADAHRKAGGYSGGMRQRLLLAQALLGDPKVLILDEPTAGLDPRERIRLRQFIHELGKDKIVLFSTHIVSDVETIADRVVLMRQGVFVKHGTVPELMAEVEPYVTEPVTGRLSLEDVYLYYVGK